MIPQHKYYDDLYRSESCNSLALCWKPTLSITVLGYNDENSSICSNTQAPLIPLVSQSLQHSDGDELFTLPSQLHSTALEQRFRADSAPSHRFQNDYRILFT